MRKHRKLQNTPQWRCKDPMVGLLFPRKHYRYLTIWQVFWLTLSTPSSHTTMAPYSDVADWVSTLELTAAGLRRTLTGFPLGVLFGRPNRLQKYKKILYHQILPGNRLLLFSPFVPARSTVATPSREPASRCARAPSKTPRCRSSRTSPTYALFSSTSRSSCNSPL